MSKKRLREDYDVVENVDERGKIRTDVVYKGVYYEPLSSGKLKTAAVATPILTVLAAIAYLVPLIVLNQAAKTIYFTVAYVGQIFPIFFLFGVCFDLVFKRPPYKEKEKRSITERSKILCIIGEAMAVFSMIAFIVYWATQGAFNEDFFALVGSAVCAVCYAFIFVIINNVTLVRVGKEENGAD